MHYFNISYVYDSYYTEKNGSLQQPYKTKEFNYTYIYNMIFLSIFYIFFIYFFSWLISKGYKIYIVFLYVLYIVYICLYLIKHIFIS